MNLEQLNYLLAVKQYHSMNKAAEMTFVSQQAISSGILRLEKELNLTLLTRTNKGSYLSEAGLRLCDIVERFYSDINLLKNNIYNQTSSLTILIEQSCEFLWTELFIYFQKTFPHISLKKIPFTLDTLQTELEKHNDAIALGFFDELYLKSLNNVTATSLGCQQYHAFLSPDNPFSSYPLLSLHDIKNVKIYIQAEKDDTTILTRFLNNYQLEKNNTLIYQTNRDLYSYIFSQPDTIQFWPSNNTHFLSDTLSKMVQIRPLKENITVHFTYLHRKNLIIPSEMTDFFTYIQTVIANYLGI